MHSHHDMHCRQAHAGQPARAPHRMSELDRAGKQLCYAACLLATPFSSGFHNTHLGCLTRCRSGSTAARTTGTVPGSDMLGRLSRASGCCSAQAPNSQRHQLGEVHVRCVDRPGIQESRCNCPCSARGAKDSMKDSLSCWTRCRQPCMSTEHQAPRANLHTHIWPPAFVTGTQGCHLAEV